MICTNCKQSLENGATFCGLCGFRVSDLGDSATVARSNINFLDAVKLGFNRYFDFRGRSSRAEFWWWALFVTITNISLGIIDQIGGFVSFLDNLFQLVILIPGLAIGARRLHDINKSGWWQLMWFVGFFIAPLILLIWWATRPSDEETNKYGPDQREDTL